MDQMKLGIQFHQRLRGPEKKITAKIKIGEKIVDHLRLRGGVEIDQHIAAENQIYTLHEKHPGVVLQVETAERDQLFHLGVYLQFLLIDGREVFLLIKIAGVAQRVIAVDAALGGFDAAVIQISSDNLHPPALPQASP